MTLLLLLLLFVAALCFLGHAFGATLRRINLLSLGLFFWVTTVFLKSLAAVS